VEEDFEKYKREVNERERSKAKVSANEVLFMKKNDNVKVALYYRC